MDASLEPEEQVKTQKLQLSKKKLKMKWKLYMILKEPKLKLSESA